MPQLTVLSNELSGSGTGVPTGTGAAFIVGTSDAGPPPSGPAYVACRSLNDFVNAFGPRTSSSATLYDWLDEFFHDGGNIAYVARVTDVTATTATLTLNDAGAKPTVVVSALTPGLEGNLTQITVAAGTAATFTANTTSSSTSIANISSSKNLGIGTLVTGTGIPASTYIVSVNAAAKTAVLTQAATATATAVVLTPGTVTLTVAPQDASGNPIATETHGPYNSTTQLYADTTSAWVTFAQSAASQFTPNLPAALVATALTGGADANDLTDASYVTTLANFPTALGPGTVALPGLVSTTAWNGLLAHAAANNRFAALDMTDSSSSSTVVTAAGQLGTPSNASYGMFTQGSLILPGLLPNTTRTVAGSAAVAALRAQVAAQPSQNQAPAGLRWPLSYPLGFTQYFGPTPSGATTAGNFSQSDVNTMSSAGVNCFASFFGSLCLFGFVTPVSKNADQTYWQASASIERMALTGDCQTAMARYLFQTIDGAGITYSAMHADLATVIQNHWNNRALFGDSATAAGEVVTDPPINTAATAAAGQLNAELYVRISPYADTVNITVTVVPITQAVPQEVTN